MKLYHGGSKMIKEPKYNGSRDQTDFCRGFYLTVVMNNPESYEYLK